MDDASEHAAERLGGERISRAVQVDLLRGPRMRALERVPSGK